MTPEEIKLVAMSIAGIVLLAIFVGGAVWIWRRMRTPSPNPDQIAIISERVTYSAGGLFAVLLLALSNAAAIYIWLAAINIVSETALAVLWIGNNVLWGVGVIVGRKRTYHVYRMPSTE